MRLQKYINEKAFHVSMKEINDILYILDIYRNQIDNIKDMKHFVKLVNATIKEGTGKTVKFEVIDKDTSSITGHINGETYEITIYVSKYYFNNIKDDNIWRDFNNGVIGTLKHEITHGLQLLKVSDEYWKNNSNPIKVKDIKDIAQRKKNRAHKHEIMAYAQNIIVELINHFGINEKKIINYLKHYKQGISADLDEYMLLFDNNGKTIKLLYRYMTDIIKNTVKEYEITKIHK